MNGYNYANNNPVMYFDPDGNWAWLIPVVIGAGKIVYKFRKPIAKYGDKGKGYWGIRYSKKKNGKKTYKSWEFHTPHNGHGWHLQRNNYSKHNGKWRRSSKGTKRITLKKAKDRRSKKSDLFKRYNYCWCI